MNICMVVYDMQKFGGLEEYAVNLAIALRNQRHRVSFLSAEWVEPENQYVRRLKESDIPLAQPPGWISRLASDWETKEKVLRGVLRLACPLTFFLAAVMLLTGKRPFTRARTSAHNWLRGHIMKSLIGPDRRQSLARCLLKWWRLRWRPDLLHIHGYTTNLLFVVDWASGKMPVVYEEHQTPDPKFDWWTGFQKTVNKAAVVIAVSERSAQGLREVCGVTRPIAVIGPLLPDPFESDGRDTAVSEHSEKSIEITTIARLYVTKGLPYLLQAAAQLKSRYSHANFRVYGDGELRQELLEQARLLGLDGGKIFVGPFTTRKELSQIMSGTDIFVMPSLLEGQPVGLVEAMAYGCPIVATAVGGIPELIDDGNNGLLCRPENPEDLAAKISTLIETPALRQKLGREARASYMRGAFHPKAVSSRLISVYTGVLEQARGSARIPG
jgi:glycosyltransferase involved in cell wall biosynthesis